MITLFTTVIHPCTGAEFPAQILHYSHAGKMISLQWKLADGKIRRGDFCTKNGKCIEGDQCGGFRLGIAAKEPYYLHWDTRRSDSKNAKLKQAKQDRLTKKELLAANTTKTDVEVNLVEVKRSALKNFKPD